MCKTGTEWMTTREWAGGQRVVQKYFISLNSAWNFKTAVMFIL